MKPDLEDLAQHPFGQGEYYFSESQGKLVRLAEMPLPYARNCMRKLLNEYQDEFRGSPLHDAFIRRLVPTRNDLCSLLKAGAASIYIGDSGLSSGAARSRLRRAGAAVTHKNGDFIEGTAEVAQVKISVRGK